MVKTKDDIRELADKRRVERGTNKHEMRSYEVTYQGQPRLFHLDRTLDACPPSYELYWFHTDDEIERGYPVGQRTLTVRGEQYWGGGAAWEDAEERAKDAILMLMGSSDPFNLTRTPTPPSAEWLRWFRHFRKYGDDWREYPYDDAPSAEAPQQIPVMAG